MNSALIRSALLCDGSGRPPEIRDVLFENGVILEIAPHLSARTGIPEFPAENLMLAPGFVDIHAHSDLSLPAEPEAFGKISQGVTTEVSGNCGLSPFPVLTAEVREHLEKIYAKYGLPVAWTDLAGYAAFVESRNPAVNFCMLCGHNTLRANVLGYDEKSGSREDWLRICDLLRKELRNGAAGMSAGLLYVPGKFACKEELEITASALRGTGKIVASHLRSEGKFLLESVREMIEIARAGSGSLQISHMKTAKPENWHKLEPLLRMIAEEKTVKIHADRYPYTRAMTSLSVILPPPWETMTDAAIQADLRENPESALLLKKRLQENPPAWHEILLCSTAESEVSAYKGRSMAEIAEILHIPPEDLCVRLMLRDAPGTMASFSGLSPENLAQILRQDYVCCGSDESARPLSGPLNSGHPRGFGAFPEFFRQVSSMLGPAEAVRKMSALPAEILHLKNRGRIAPGFAADMVLFDPGKFRAKADFAAPAKPASGLRAVWVNGTLSFFEGRVIARAGKFLGV